jgi:glycosyltransferase involved in cell wall biosynthesis
MPPESPAPSETARPEISVVTPIYERTEQLPGLLATLAAQDWTDWELVLVDDASTADIAAALAAASGGDDPRIRLIRLEANGGPSVARNAGIDAVRGRFVAFLDSDDHWAPSKLSAQRAALLAMDDPDRGFATCATEVRHGGGATAIRPERGLRPGERPASYLYVDNMFAQCSAFFCGAGLLRDGLRFETRLRQYEDHLFFMEAATRAAATACLPEVLSVWENDDRPDRMGAADDVARGRAFQGIAAEAGLMDAREALAFELRCLAPVMLARDRVAALRLAWRGARAGLPREAWAKVLLAGAIGPARYARLRAARRRGG